MSVIYSFNINKNLDKIEFLFNHKVTIYLTNNNKYWPCYDILDQEYDTYNEALEHLKRYLSKPIISDINIYSVYIIKSVDSIDYVEINNQLNLVKSACKI